MRILKRERHNKFVIQQILRTLQEHHERLYAIEDARELITRSRTEALDITQSLIKLYDVSPTLLTAEVLMALEHVEHGKEVLAGEIISLCAQDHSLAERADLMQLLAQASPHNHSLGLHLRDLEMGGLLTIERQNWLLSSGPISMCEL